MLRFSNSTRGISDDMSQARVKNFKNVYNRNSVFMLEITQTKNAQGKKVPESRLRNLI